jgi:16S rRNA (guanine527-N7)-methyltransferase
MNRNRDGEAQAVTESAASPPGSAVSGPTLGAGAVALGLALSPEQEALFARFQAELLDWNQRMNLTAITEPEEICVRHFLDSLSAAAAFPKALQEGQVGARLIDVGAGAGLPGIPLAIAFPRLTVVLLEATQKKCRFLDHVLQTLPLPNATVLCGRAEEIGQRVGDRAAFDLAIARGVAPLATLVELCLPLLRIGGRLIAPKKLGIEHEVAVAQTAIRTLGGRLAMPVRVQVPGLDEARQLIIVEKVRPTPAAYPRRPGLPAKLPLT